MLINRSFFVGLGGVTVGHPNYEEGVGFVFFVKLVLISLLAPDYLKDI